MTTPPPPSAAAQATATPVTAAARWCIDCGPDGNGTPRYVVDEDTCLQLETALQKAKADLIFDLEGLKQYFVDPKQEAAAWKRAFFALMASDRKTPFTTLELNSETRAMVGRFAVALADKLAEAEAKYGHWDAWMKSDWMEKCQADLEHHLAKGDPRDVAAYCAFMWFHKWPTKSSAHQLERENADLVSALEECEQMMDNGTYGNAIWLVSKVRVLIASHKKGAGL